MCVTSVLGKLRQEDGRFMANLDYKERHCLKTEGKKTSNSEARQLCSKCLMTDLGKQLSWQSTGHANMGT